MAECIVGMRVGSKNQFAMFRLELSDDWVHLRALAEHTRGNACRLLYHLHLQYHALDTPHRLALAKDDAGLEYIDCLSIPSTLAEEYLFPKLAGLADEADVKHGIH